MDASLMIAQKYQQVAASSEVRARERARVDRQEADQYLKDTKTALEKQQDLHRKIVNVSNANWIQINPCFQ